MKLFTIIFLIILFFDIYSQNKSEFFVLLKNNDYINVSDSIKSDKFQKEHIKFITKLIKDGVCSIVGNFEEGGEILIINAHDKEAIQNLLKEDPAIENIRFSIEILPIKKISGFLCKVEAFSKMLSYGFVRINLIKNGDQIINEKTDEFFNKIKTEMKLMHKLFYAAVFEDNSGLFLIMNDINERFLGFLKNQYYDNGPISGFEIKKIWIDKNYFCKGID